MVYARSTSPGQRFHAEGSGQVMSCAAIIDGRRTDDNDVLWERNCVFSCYPIKYVFSIRFHDRNYKLKFIKYIAYLNIALQFSKYCLENIYWEVSNYIQ